jgi:hypothetical protein
VTLCGTAVTALCRVGRSSFRGDENLNEHCWSRRSVWPSVRALTAMATDQRPDGPSTRFPRVDWELYRQLKSEGRLNLLFRFCEPGAASFLRPEVAVPRPNVLPFVSRSEHLAWRARWKNGRRVKLSWTPEERSAIHRQDEGLSAGRCEMGAESRAVPEGGSILKWRHEPDAGMQGEQRPRGSATTDEVSG